MSSASVDGSASTFQDQARLLERGATREDGVLVSVADVGEARVPRRGPKRHGRARPLDRRGQESVRRLCRARRKASGADPARLVDREQYVSTGHGECSYRAIRLRPGGGAETRVQ